MATTTASAAQSTAPAYNNVNGTITRIVTYTIVASASAGDVIQMVKVPMGAIVSSVRFAMNGHSGVLTVNVGDGNDVSAYAASVVLSGSAVALASIPSRGIGRSYSAEDTIDITFSTVTSASAVGSVRLTVFYTNGMSGV